MSLTSLRLKFEAKPYLWAYVVGATLLLICGCLWWLTVFTGPKHVFWSMLENSLHTESVVMRSDQSSGPNHLRQSTHVDTGAGMARSLTTIKEGVAEVKTETIGTKDADYTRYVSIASDTNADVSKVVGVWSRSDTTAQTETQASGHDLYAQATLGIGLPLGSVPVPIGNVSPAKRQELLDFIHAQQIYKPDFSKVKKEYKDGRLLYTYDVTVQAVLYVSLMKAFAKDLGLHELEAANPNSYQSNPIIKVSLTVDALSHRLARVNFVEAGYSQAYESYGLPLETSVPKKTISSAELQKRLEAIGQQQRQ